MKDTPWLLISDPHFHDWAQFAKHDEHGVNSRLNQTLLAFNEACAELGSRGGKTVVFAGDVFHVRGSLKPSVLNPLKWALQAWIDEGFTFFAIDGNHDLEARDSTATASAIEALSSPHFCPVHHSDVMIGALGARRAIRLIPWVQSLDQLRATACKHADPDTDLVIHAPLNGVIKGIPDTGLDPKDVESWGYNRVFVGHYHNHKSWNDKVFSVGALTHQTWSDVGARAGYMLVYPDRTEQIETTAPKFIDYDFHWTDAEAEQHCKGNYIRATMQEATETQLKEFSALLESYGAKDWMFRVTPKSETVARTAVPSAGVSMEASVSEWIATKFTDDATEITKRALSVLGKTA